ncbi:uncharacterized protein LOC127414937 isoform X3 [Myxocyprinus asiaticus]|uniref:uncharacterized protein LOC127414937 isoform X3 n=1 Tax=Myxocyprinus asiaticus TaxID=70543 RepID=UPI00222220C9|nr:uncharacterized protein LOC127414937 isoform X3 [Myxocyprinus asiaticus]
MMIPLIVWAFTLCVVVNEAEPLLITADCRDNIILPCAALQNSQNYTSVTWYKAYNETSFSIIIKVESVDTQTDKYNSSVLLDKNASLILRKVSPANTGTYECLIRAKVGGINNRSLLTLNISDCMSTVSPIFAFSTKFINGSSENIGNPLTHVSKDAGLITIWTSVGLALSKVLLSAVCIWVFKELRELRRKRQT